MDIAQLVNIMANAMYVVIVMIVIDIVIKKYNKILLVKVENSYGNFSGIFKY